MTFIYLVFYEPTKLPVHQTMKNIPNHLVIFCFPLFILFTSCTGTDDLSELNPFLRKSVTWKCEKLNKDVPLKIYYHQDSTDAGGAQVIVYVTNRAWERIGQESDLSILRDNIRNKFIVITVDLGNEPKAVSTFIDKDLHDIFRAVYGTKTESLLKDIRLKPINFRCFFMPAGYRVATDLVYWELDKHAVYGTLEYVMKSYNEDILPKVPGLKPVNNPFDMVDRKGKPFDWTVKMDIVYPSQAKRKLPVLVNSETISERNPNSGPGSYRPHYIGFTMRGYVHVVMGHCFNPCVNHYFHFNKFELDHWNGLACYTAALRYIHMNAGKYSMDTDHIGAMGHSKGQYAVTRLSDPNHAGGTESKKFEGFPEGTPEPQPWQGYPSDIQVGYQSMGMGTFEPEYITTDYVPTIFACGEKERDVISREGFPKFAKRLEELDVNHISMLMEGLEHELPYGYDKNLGIDRYEVFHNFFDRYLKPDEKLPPVILIVIPRDSATDVRPDTEISVQFAPIIDERTILEEEGIRLVSIPDNAQVKGSWKISRGGTKFTFRPEQPLKAGNQYKMIISRSVKDKTGTKIATEKSVKFTTGVL
jgi:hypothetical protein